MGTSSFAPGTPTADTHAYAPIGDWPSPAARTRSTVPAEPRYFAVGTPPTASWPSLKNTSVLS